MYIASWNEKGYNKIYTTTNSIGNFVGKSENPSTLGIEFSNNEEGVNDSLYSPHNELCFAYWIASPSARDINRLIYINIGEEDNRHIDGGTCNDSNTLDYGIRPIVCLNDVAIGKVEDDLVIIE